MARKTQELRPVMVRLPESLRQRLERRAERSGRSMNTEIIYRLQESLAREWEPDPTKGKLTVMNQNLLRLEHLIRELLEKKDEGEKK